MPTIVAATPLDNYTARKVNMQISPRVGRKTKKRCRVMHILSLCILLVVANLFALKKRVVLDAAFVTPPIEDDVPHTRSYGLPEGHPRNAEMLPAWMREYLSFHRRTRARSDFPGAADIKFLVVCCPHGRYPCGGLGDRLKSFDYYVHMANTTGRVLLYYWASPRPMEDFLVPPEGGLDWRIPPGLVVAQGERSFRMCRYDSRAEQNKCFFGGDNKVISNKATQTDQVKYMHDYVWTDEDRARAKKSISPVSPATLLFEDDLDGNKEAILSRNDPRLKGSDFSVAMSPIQTVLFDLMFKPIPRLEEKIRNTMSSLGIAAGHYGAAHVRASFPTKFSRKKGFRGKNGLDYDKEDSLLLVGSTKHFVMSLTRHATTCAKDLTTKYLKNVNKGMASIPIFVASDSVDTIKHLMLENTLNPGMHLVSLPPHGENLHLDAQHNIGSSAKDYDSVFVDLWIIKNAACVAYGVGWYGFFGALLTGNSCMVRHQTAQGTLSKKC